MTLPSTTFVCMSIPPGLRTSYIFSEKPDTYVAGVPESESSKKFVVAS